MPYIGLPLGYLSSCDNHHYVFLIDILDVIPDKNDLMIVLAGINSTKPDDVVKWREYFAKRLLKKANKSDEWFSRFTTLEFFIDEITGENVHCYNYTWGTVIEALEKPRCIKFGSPETDALSDVANMVRGHLRNHDVYEKYQKRLMKEKLDSGNIFNLRISLAIFTM